MLQKQYPLPVKFICPFIYSGQEFYLQARDTLEKEFGSADFQSQEIAFTFTDYYRPEMGPSLMRRFISFERLRDPADFADIKGFCLKVEKGLACGGKRRVNIDPGYLNEAKLVLTTTKDFSHRVYLGKGVYAEVTLYYREGRFCDFSYTFPDYRTDIYKQILSRIRDIYRDQLKNATKG